MLESGFYFIIFEIVFFVLVSTLTWIISLFFVAFDAGIFFAWSLIDEDVTVKHFFWEFAEMAKSLLSE